ARAIWQSLGGEERLLPPSTLVKWEDDEWPGNVRELRNAVARQLALGELAALGHDATTREDEQDEASPTEMRDDVIEHVIGMRLPFVKARERIMQEFERRYVARLLADHGDDVARAAAASGIGRRYFQMIRARTR